MVSHKGACYIPGGKRDYWPQPEVMKEMHNKGVTDQTMLSSLIAFNLIYKSYENNN